jgi:hypothetical protein
MSKFFFLVLFIFGSAGFSFAQEKTPDTLKKSSDTLSLTATAKHRANTAAMYSAIIPGTGQIYNKSYWKVPVIYAGFGVLVYFISFNNDNYQTFKKAYSYRIDGDSTTDDGYPNYTNDDLLVRRDYYRRNRDLCYVFVGVVYVLNIIDAYVDAHLKDFDVSDNLSLHTSPFFNLGAGGAPVAGLSLCLKIK